MSRRIRAARWVLSGGVIIQLLLISALPFDAWKTADRGSLIVLATMVVISIVIAATLVRSPKASVRMLALMALLSAWQVIHFARLAIAFLPNQSGQTSAGRTAAFLVASLAYLSFPLALIVAWPLRHLAHAGEHYSAFST